MNETIKAKFGEILHRNYETGDCQFTIYPYRKHTLQDCSGAIHCSGKIYLYGSGTPLILFGNIVDNTFFTKITYIPTQDNEDIVHYLKFAVPEFSDAQMREIVKIVTSQNANDLFSFLKQRNSRAVLENTLNNSSKKDYCIDKLYESANRILNNESLFKKLIKYQVPYDCIWSFIEKGIDEKQINRNPYKMLTSFGTSLFVADNYAKKALKYTDFSYQRLKGFVKTALNNSADMGNSCIPFENLIQNVNKLLKMASSESEPVSMPAALVYYCLCEMPKDCSVQYINGKSYVYLYHIWNEENNCVHHTKRLIRNKTYTNCSFDLDKIENELQVHYSHEQREAFHLLDTNGIKILTGPPGSGKTAIIRGLIKAFSNRKQSKIALAATTGIAAKVLTKSCHIADACDSAKTVHSLLNITPYENGGIYCSCNLEHPLDADLIIVDEVSMLDLQIFSALVSSIKNKSILLLVGDDEQLQSVGCGNVLNDLIKTGMVETYRLTKVFRQSDNSIYENAKLINTGNPNVLTDCSFHLNEYDNEEEARTQLFKDIKTKNVSQYSVLSPIKNKGSLSVAELNSAIQQMVINPTSTPFTYGNRNFYPDDKIIMTLNNYEKGYVNGDIGTFIEKSPDGIMISIADKTILLDYCDVRYMDLSYALTIHKSQGTECDYIYIVLPDCSPGMLTRRLLYTAVTRAKKEVHIYSVSHAFESAVSNKTERQRITLFKDRLLTE